VKVDMKETNVADEIKDLRSRTWDGYVAATAEPMCHMAFLPGIGIYSKGPFSLTSHPAFDELYEELVTTTDLVRQASLCRDLDKLIYDEDLFMVTFQQIRTYAVDKRVSFEPSVTGMPRYKFGAIKEIVHGAHR